MAGLPGGATALGKVGFRSCRPPPTPTDARGSGVSRAGAATDNSRHRVGTRSVHNYLFVLPFQAGTALALPKGSCEQPPRVRSCTPRCDFPRTRRLFLCPRIDRSVNGGETELSRSRGIEVTPRLPLRSFIVRPVGHFAVAVLHLDCDVACSSASLLLSERRLVVACCTS
jgi:hypothetical protein